MYKNTLFTGKPVLSQFLKSIPEDLLSTLVKKHATDRYCKCFKGFDPVVTAVERLLVPGVKGRRYNV
jgi:hypothetical protein